jgi:CrcB protein
VQRFLIVVGAGGIGSGVRYLIALAAGDKPGEGFPLGTFIVNMLGSFLMAVVSDLALRGKHVPAPLALALTTGFMGGFTTYSAFNFQTTALYETGRPVLAAANVAATVLGCLAFGALGLVLARRLA